MKIAKHSFYNLLGLGLPLVAAVFTIPVLISSLGEARFGLLTLIWAVVSYLGLFDLGLGRALTQQVAIAIAKNDRQTVGALVGTSLVMMSGLGLLAWLIMMVTAPWGVGLINAVPDFREAVYSVYAMALAMPFIVLTSGFRGILEARNAFGIINLIRVPMGLYTFLGPALVVVYGQPKLDVIAAVLSCGRIIACVIHGYFAWRVLPKEHGGLRWDRGLLNALCVSGGWITTSNVISPLMGYLDRFIIGGVVSTSAVAYYATPHEIVTKLWIVPAALTAVLFPMFSAQTSQNSLDAWRLFRKAVRYLFFILLPITMALALFAQELLSIWINPIFAEESAPILQIFAFGIFVNCLAHVPFTLLQGAGNARITAIIHAGQLPVFVLALWWLTSVFGVVGAAVAWLLRMLVDTFLMFLTSAPILGQTFRRMIGPPVLFLSVVAVTGFSGLLFDQVQFRLAWLISVIVVAVGTLLHFKRYDV